MAGRVKISAHVLGYSLALIPALYYGYHYQQNKPFEEDFEEKLRENYAHNINGSSSKRKDMHKFLDALKRGESNEQMDKVLRAGNGGMKRLNAVDERYYGKEEGLRVKKKVVGELEEKRKGRKNMMKKGNAEKKEIVNETDDQLSLFQKQSMIALGAIGAVTLVTVILGDRR